MQHKVTLIVPIYNIDEALLRRCIDSLLSQTLSDIEIILINDGSPDNSGIICDEYAGKDARIKVFHTENKGVSNARNVGIDNATGEYLCFIDPDDYLETDCIENTYNAAINSNTDILMFRHRIDGKESVTATGDVNAVDSSEISTLKVNTITKKDGKYDTGMCWSKLYRASFIADNELRYELGVRKAQDRLFVYDCLCRNPVIHTYDYVGYVYTTNNGNSICRRYNPGIVKILDNTASKFQMRIDKEADETIINAGYTMNVLFLNEIFLLYICHKQNDMPVGEKVKIIKNIFKNKTILMAVKKAKLSGLSKREKLMTTLLRVKLYTLCILMYKM